MKKFFSILLTLAMLVALLPVYGVAAEGAEAVSIGGPVQRSLLISYSITEQDGVPVMVGVSSGNPATLVVMNLATREKISDHKIANGKTFYAYAKASNGDVYFAGTSAPINLYKYSVTDKTVTDLGSVKTDGYVLGIGSYTATAVLDMTVDSSDNVYLATYPDSHVLKWDGSSFSDMGTVYSDDDYAKTIGYHNGKVYVGGNKEGTSLVEIDVNTKSKQSYTPSFPSGVVLTSMYASNIIDDRMFIFCHTKESGYYTITFDLVNKTWKQYIDNSMGSYAIPSNDGNAYIVKGNKLYTYNLTDDSVTASKFTGSIGGIRTKDNAMINGQPYISYTPHGQTYISLINLATGSINKYENVVPEYPDMLESFMLDSNGDIYASVYQGGIMNKYDPYSQEVLESFSAGQASVIKEIDGKIYYATYPTGDLCMYDPSQPVSATNPKTFYDMKLENQSRPMDIVKAGDKLIVSHIGGYGDADNKSTGYIMVYDTTTGYYTQYKGGELEDYSIVGLYYDAEYSRLFATTTTVGGHNSTPVYDNATVFYFYLEEGTITENSTVEIETEDMITIEPSTLGVSKKVVMCGGIEKDPKEDKLWVACYNGVFSIDMDDFEVVDTIITNTGASISRWQPYQLAFDKEGMLYATPADELVKIDTANKTWTKIADDVFDMAIDEFNGQTAIYTLDLKGSEIYVINQLPERVIPDKVDGVYQIKSFEDFMYIAQEPTAKYKLVNDITVGTAEEPFTAPFGFSGEFDGNGKTINVNIKAAGSVGLFASQPVYNGKATIKNLTLTGSVTRTDAAAAEITSGKDCSVGAFIGYADNHSIITIENCVNKATVNGGKAGYYVGGIIGKTWGLYPTVIKNTKNYGNVTIDQGAAQGGGIAGQFSGTISECANGGIISKSTTSNYYIGGLVGEARKTVLIEKSANFGNVVTPGYAGGLIGRAFEVDASKSITINDSFNAGAVSGGNPGGGASAIIGGRTDNGTALTVVNLNNVYNTAVMSGARTRIFICIGGDQPSVTVNNAWYNVNYNGSGFNSEGNKGIHMFSASQKTVADLGFDSSIWTWDKAVYDYPYITSVGVMPTGTANAPFEIKTAEDFMAIKNAPSAYYKLMNDITIGTEEEPFTAPFEFTGVLDGNGKTITAYIKGTGIPTGLFSKITDASKGIEVKNLTLKGRIERTDTTDLSSNESAVGGLLGYANSYVKVRFDNCVNEAEIVGNAARGVGGFAGYTFGFTETAPNDCVFVTNCINKGTISANNLNAVVGGLLGVGGGTIRNCVNAGKITGTTAYTGGIAGKITKSGDITKCVNIGEINLTRANGAGGIAGAVWDGSPVIKDCYNAGAVTNVYNNAQYSSAGGFVGRGFTDTTAATFENCYNSGNVTSGATTPIGQIAGSFYGGFSAVNTYYVSGTDSVSGTAAFGAKSTLEELGFDSSVWSWDKDAFYKWPTLNGQSLETGTDAFPYVIKTADDFMAIKNNPSASYYVANDIELGEYEPFEFKGHLFGKVNAETGEYTAIDVAINMPTTLGVGLFSNINGLVKIENIKLTGSVHGGGVTGGFVGYVGNTVFDENTEWITNGSYIKNCVNEADISVAPFSGGNTNYAGRGAGGFIGYYKTGAGRFLALSNLENRGNIYAQLSYAGGITGNSKGILTNCVNKGTVSGDNCIGGISGFSYDNRAMTNCYNAGVVQGSAGLGGLVGRWQHPGGGVVISNCYNAGEVVLNNENYAHMVGSAIGDVIGSGAANVSNFYNSGKVKGSYCDAIHGSQATVATATNSYSLTVDGDEDENASTLGIAGLEAAAATLGDAFAASTNAYPFPQLKAVANDKALTVLMVEDVEIDETEACASLKMATNLTGKEAMLVVAVYNEDGTLASAKVDSKPINKSAASFSADANITDGQSVKVFLWDANMTPYNY